ncbi:ABC transporter ATP-binding protein [Actinomyces gaoshouyii]|uniref:ABC transporter n=1 Tax=Actinomyces gaoshouyii TaxID=1960083 RepID=A0A8H9LDZ1_9ACTO|nr:ABC transporter ATP-binding protein [Actinomyces gaoshouyii]GGO94825.1 ABC transporter [Actinomyces gaoshouyii]
MADGLSIDGLRVVYSAGRGAGPVVAVDGVGLEIPSGRITALLGASGSGKSSLLRAVAGLEPVAAGAIRWDGRDVVATPVHKRGFGLMFQEGQLFPFRDVAGNVGYGLTGMTRAQRARRVAEMLDLVGLPGYAARPITTLSGGQAQRVALARALAPRPRLLLLDEPLSALDRALREQLAGDLRAILTEHGATALYVTHDQDEAMTVADEVGVMEAGRLSRLAAPEALWADPGSAGVAAFLGFAPILAREQAEALGWGSLLAGDRPGARGSRLDGAGVGLALAPGALSIVGPQEGGPGADGAGTRGSAELPGASGTVLARRMRRGGIEVDVSLDVPGGPAVVAAGAGGGNGSANGVGTRVRLGLDPSRTAIIEF